MSPQAGDRYVTAVMAVTGVLNAGSGVWAFIAPRSFYDTIATFPPYNVHFLHDIGAFLTGIGVALLVSLAWRDAKFVVLTGAAAAASMHLISHVIDREHGGSASDPWTLGAVALALLIGAVLRWPRRHGAPTQHKVAAR